MSDFFFHDHLMSLIILGALTGDTEIPSVFIGLLCSLNDNAARLMEGHCAETCATATSLKTVDFCGEGLLQNELRRNKLIFK